MSYSQDEANDRARKYAARHGLMLGRRLGYGIHGCVWSSGLFSAVKAHAPGSRHYATERDIYLRLQERSVSQGRGFAVPQLLGLDDDLWVVEMSIVQPPFVLDFAGAYLDERPDYAAEIWAEWEADKQEQFGGRHFACLRL